MGTWSITPSTASIDQNGNVTFPKNTESTEKTYTIKYTDGDMVCEKKVIQEGTGCIFSYDANSTNIPGDRESEYTFGTITPNGADVSQITIEVYEGAEYINGSLSINSSNQVVGTVKKNETQSSRTIKYKLKTANKSVCYDKTATQGKGCDCSSFSVTARSVGKDAGAYTFATYTADPCITEITATENSDWITAIGVNTTDKTITGTVKANGSVSEKTTTINVSGKAGTLTCPLSFELTQGGIDCPCETLQYYTRYTNMFNKEARTVVLGKVKVLTSCIDNLELVTHSSGKLTLSFGSRTQEGNYTIVEVKGDLTKAENSRELKYSLGMKGCTKKDYFVYQNCWRGTDNGIDEYYREYDDYQEPYPLVKYDYPVYICGDGGSDADTIAVKTLRIKGIKYYDDNHTSGVQLTRGNGFVETNLHNNNIIGSSDYKCTIKDSDNGNDFYEMWWATGGPTSGLCGEGMIQFKSLGTYEKAFVNGATNYRNVIITFETDPTERVVKTCCGWSDTSGTWHLCTDCTQASSGQCVGCNCSGHEVIVMPEHAGEAVCDSWDFNVVQITRGYKLYETENAFEYKVSLKPTGRYRYEKRNCDLIVYDAPSKLPDSAINPSSMYYVVWPNTTLNPLTAVTKHDYSNGVGAMELNESIHVISSGAFARCSSVTKLYLPKLFYDGSDAQPSIKANAFTGLTNMKELYLANENPPTLENASSLNGIPSDCIIYVVDEEAADAYRSATHWSSLASRIRVIPY